MPWTPKQHKLFEAAAHDPAVAKRVQIPMAQASKMASEGVKKQKKKPAKISKKKVVTPKPKPGAAK